MLGMQGEETVESNATCKGLAVDFRRHLARAPRHQARALLHLLQTLTQSGHTDMLLHHLARTHLHQTQVRLHHLKL